MNCTVAIQPDDYTDPATPDKCDASSPKWAELLEAVGHEVRWVDVYRADILDQLRGCHGFMWRHAHSHDMQRVARPLLPVLERELGLVVYPDQNTCWHYDDKIAQRFLLEAARIPIPKTWVWFESASALDWAETATYPMVLKLSAGAGSTNVRLVRSFEELQPWIHRLFGGGVDGLANGSHRAWSLGKRVRATANAVLRGRPLADRPTTNRLHKNYVLLQEFLPDNPFDSRITIIGNRAFGFRRFNRAGDFRASGSGLIDYDPNAIDLQMVRLAFLAADRLSTQSIAIDGLRRGKESVIGEISYTYASWAVHECAGHWRLEGGPTDGDLVWQAGQMWPEEAQLADFRKRLEDT